MEKHREMVARYLREKRAVSGGHDNPGVIIVSLNSDTAEQIQADLEAAFAQAEFVFNTEGIAVFKHGYSKPEGQ